MKKFRMVKGNPIDKGAVTQMETCLEDECVRGGALCADHHLGYSMPIGGVVAYDKNHISPSGVGYDIGCGNKAVKTNVHKSELEDGEITRIMDAIYSEIHFGMKPQHQYKSDAKSHIQKVEHEIFELPIWDEIGYLKNEPELMIDLAKLQLGSVGSGNHYVDIFHDEDDYLWVGVHFGSRGFGHKICTGFMNVSKNKNFFDKPGHEDMNANATILSLDSYVGQDYYECMKLAGAYAYAGRDVVCEKVLDILRAEPLEEIHNHHNFAWKETHDFGDYTEEVMVVRKGSTPAFPGQKCFIGGSMGDISVIAEGIDSEESKLLLHSTVHGAGRAMSRSKAAGKRRWKKGKLIKKTEGLISQEAMKSYLQRSNVVLRGGDVDEAPQAYKRIEDVLEQHKESLRVVHKLYPMGVAMASSR